jgi:hypothetical protein
MSTADEGGSKSKVENTVTPDLDKKKEKVGPDVPFNASEKEIYRGAIVDHGEAKYKNIEKNDKSYYLKLEQLNGEKITLWGKGLPESIPKESKKGDYIGVERGEREPVIVKVKVKDELGKETFENKDVLRQRWLSVNVNQEKDRQDYQAQKNDPNKAGIDGQPKQRHEKFTHSKAELEEAEKRIPSLERVVPGTAIQNRYLMTAERNKNSYADRRKPDVKLVEDRGGDIKVKEVTPESIELVVKLAKEKNWDKINITGSKDFKRQLWMEASKEGIEVKGYTPSKEEIKAMEKYMAVNKNSENIVKPIVENSKQYASENIKNDADKARFSEAVKTKANDVVKNEGVPTLNEKAVKNSEANKEKDVPRKDKSKEIER